MNEPEYFDLAASEDALETFLLGEEPEWEEEPVAPPNPDRANALLGRLRRLLAARATDQALVQRGVDQLGRWYVDRDEPRKKQEAWIRTSLRAYHVGVLFRSNVATVALPNGDLVSRQGQPTWEFSDEEAFLAWATMNAPDLVRQKPPPPPEIDKNAAKAYLTRRDEKGKALDYGVTPEGEKPPGLKVLPAIRDFDLKLGGEG